MATPSALFDLINQMPPRPGTEQSAAPSKNTMDTIQSALGEELSRPSSARNTDTSRVRGQIDKVNADADMIAQQKLPTPTRLPALNTKPPELGPDDPLSVFKTLAPVMAMLGSFGIKGPNTAGIDIATSALKAHAEGRTADYQAARQKWEDENKAMMNQAKMYTDQYDMDWKSAEGNIKKFEAMRLAHAAAAGNELEVARIQAGDHDSNARDHENRLKTLAQMETAQTKLAEKNSGILTDEMYREKYQNDPTIEGLAKSYANGVPITQIVPGWSKNNPKRDAVIRKAFELNPNLDWSEAHNSYLGEQSEKRAVGTQTGKIKLASNILESSIPSLLKSAEKVGLSSSTDLNTLYNTAKRHLSDKDFSNFSTQLRAVTSDYAQFIGRGRLTVHSDQEALRILNENMGITSLEGFADAVNIERGNVDAGISKTEGKSSDNVVNWDDLK